MRDRIVKVMIAVAVILLAVLAILAVVVQSGTRRFGNLCEAEKSDLRRSAKSLHSTGERGRKASSLPAPVSGYLKVAGYGEKPGIKFAVVRQQGTLRAAPDKPWIFFVAEQVFSFEPPGFVWTARARLAPFMHLLARDKFVEGKGNMLIKLFGLIAIADAGGPAIDFSAGVRYWGEAIAFPQAVRSPYLGWEAMGDSRARMVVRQGGLEANAMVEFGDEGLPIAVHSERYRDVDGVQVLTPWSGYFREWKEIDGRMFPGSWESVWRLPEGDFPAVRIENLNIQTG